MGVAERGRMLTGSDQAREMSHVDEEQRADLVADRAETGEIEMTGIG